VSDDERDSYQGLHEQGVARAWDELERGPLPTIEVDRSEDVEVVPGWCLIDGDFVAPQLLRRQTRQDAANQ
jgi:hypothetical protein